MSRNGRWASRVDKDASARHARIADGRRVESPAVGRGMGAEHSRAPGSTVFDFDHFLLAFDHPNLKI